MVHYKDYVAGWLDTSIHDFLEVLPRTSSRSAFAMITCLDSNTDLISLLAKSPDLSSAMNGARQLGNSLIVSSNRLRDPAFRDLVFFGFDEIWFFPTNQIQPKPGSLSIVGPNRIDQEKMDRIGNWMAENECSLAMGDGDGMNVIVKARGLMKYVIASTLYQPEPAFQTSELVKEDTGEP